jgi:Trypsin-like peptidase domain
MSKTLLYNELKPLVVIDNVVEKWMGIVVPFFTNDPHSLHKLIGIGSGFLVEYEKKIFLITAHHVLKDIPDGKIVTANINGKGVCINDLPFVKSDTDDLAVALIQNDWAATQGIKSLFPLLLADKASDFVKSNFFILLGYPASKNKLNSNTNDTDRRLIGYSSQQKIEVPISKTHINKPIAFSFNKKFATDTNEIKINAGSFSGNSGGPVLEVLIRKDDLNIISVILAGVFLGWDKTTKELICCRPEIVVTLIQKLLKKFSDII